MRILVEEGKARLEAADRTGATPLFVALACEELSIGVYLAGKGADLEVGCCGPQFVPAGAVTVRCQRP